MNRAFILSFFIIISLLACAPDSPDSTQKGTDTTAIPGPAVISDAYRPSITMDELQGMWNTCNQIDYIFYDLPISSSVSDSPSAQAHLRHISDTPVSATEKGKCAKAIGRIFYKAEGEDLMDAEVFFNPNCAFFVFYKKGKAIYSNKMTPAGVDHFNQMIAAANGAIPGQ